jgi:hypothetical protein
MFFKGIDFSRLAIVEDAEIRGLQPVYRIAPLVRHGDVCQNDPGIRSKRIPGLRVPACLGNRWRAGHLQRQQDGTQNQE